MPILASLRTGFEHFARQQQAFARPLPPDRVPGPVLLTVLSCPFYGVTPEDPEIRLTRACEGSCFEGSAQKKGGGRDRPLPSVRADYIGQIFQITPVPGNWTRGESAGSSHREAGSDWPLSLTAP